MILCCAHCAVVLVSRQVVKTGLRKLLFTTNPCRCLRIIIIQSKFTTLQGCESRPKVAKMSRKKADQNNFSKCFFSIWLTSQRQTADGGGSVILSIFHSLCTSLFSNCIFFISSKLHHLWTLFAKWSFSYKSCHFTAVTDWFGWV